MEKEEIGWNDNGIYAVTHDNRVVKLELGGEKERVFNYSLINKQLRFLMGEVLTVIDASIQNERQLKATKDLIKGKFSNKLSWLYELAGMPEEVQEIAEMNPGDGELVTDEWTLDHLEKTGELSDDKKESDLQKS